MFVNVYEVSRHYGGPEEGGWWYDAGHCIQSTVVMLSVRAVDPRCQPIDSEVVERWREAERAAAECIRDMLRETYPNTGKSSSVLGGDDWRVTIEDTPGADYPTERPRYE